MRRGRPRDAGADEAILSATVDALAEGGISGLSMDEIARRAGVGKATIYRRWASKEALVLDALGTKPLLPTPDTGSLRNDLLAYATAVVELFNAHPRSDVLPHLIEAACYDERLAESLREYNRIRQRPLRQILRRARTAARSTRMSTMTSSSTPCSARSTSAGSSTASASHLDTPPRWSTT